MDAKEEIRNALKDGTALIGYRRSMKCLKGGKPKMIVMADNVPDEVRKDVAHNAKASEVPVETFEGSSVDMGVFCGKPFPIAVIAIK